MSQKPSNTYKHCNRLVILSSLALMVGCSSFNGEWKAAPAAGTSPDDLKGRWQGHWKSDVDGHTGSLKCVVTQTADHCYRAHFAATYWKLFRFAYVAELTGVPRDGGIHLSGSQDLGWLAGGVYTYDGQANNAHFDCSYSSKYDHGKFVMTRP